MRTNRHYGQRVQTQQASRLPPDAEELHLWVLDNAAHVQNLGGALFETVADQVMIARFTFGAVADKLVLVACELANYALDQSLPPTVVRLYRSDPDLIVDIAYAEAAEGGQEPPGGIGLRLARRLALEVGWYADGDTRHVWAKFPTTTIPDAS